MQAAGGSVPDCGATWSQLGAGSRRIARASAGADPADAPPDVPLPSSPAGQPLGPLPLLVVSESEVRFEGRGVGGVEAVAATAATLARDLRARGELRSSTTPFEVALWAAPGVPVQRLVELLSHSPPDVRFALVARGPPAEASDAPDWVREELERVEPPDEREGVDPGLSAMPPSVVRRRRAAALWPRATRACPAAASAFPFSPERRVPPEARSTRSLIRAMRACGCEARLIEAIGALALEALQPPDGPLVRLPASLRFGTATGPGQELSLSSDADLAGLVERLGDRPAAETPLWVRVD